MSELPEGWVRATIGEVASYVQRGRSPFYVAKSDLPVVNQRCVRWYGVDSRHLKFVDPAQWEQWEPERFLQNGDILWNSTGTGTIGRAALFRSIPGYERVVADSHVTIVRLLLYAPAFLHYWIMSPAIQDRIEDMQSGSTNQVELRRDAILSTPVLVPPAEEQQRIVDKIDVLTSRVRWAQETLDEIPALLEDYRHSVLAAAFRGDLTAEWREQNPDAESADALLMEISLQRRRHWEEAELAKMLAKGKRPANEKWKEKYEKPEPFDAEGLPELPEGWCWARVEALTSRVVDGVHKKPEYTKSGIPFLTVRNLTAGPGISFDDVSYVSPEDHAEFVKRTHPEKGDVLISKDGTLGVTRLVRTDRVFSIFVSLALVKPIVRNMGEYLELAFSSPQFQERFKRSGIGLQHIHLVDLRSAVLPVAPVAEQDEIVRRCRQLLARYDALEQLRSDAADEVTQVGRSVLTSAFRGELVPQDPTDEPASVLLARIREGRAEAAAKPSSERPKAPVRRTAMSKHDMKDRIKDAILEQTFDPFSFDDLKAKVPGNYDALKVSLFDLLEKEPHVVRQVFDRGVKAMRLQRVKQ